MTEKADNITLIDRTGLDLAGVSDEQRLALWSDFVRPIYDSSLLNPAQERAVDQADAWLLDNLLLTKAAFGSQLLHRHGRHLTHDIPDYLLVEIYVSGELRGDVAGEAVYLKAGDLHILDFSREYWAHVSRADVRGVLIAHDRVGYDRHRHPAKIHIHGQSAVGRVLSGAIMSLFQCLDSTTKADGAAIANGLAGLLHGLLFSLDSHPLPSLGFAAARGRAIRDFVGQNLRSERLGADTICAAFNISRATLYRDMKRDGGLDRYILTRRLEAALKDLVSSPERRGTVTRTAEKWGFSSTSHFSREFTREFGFGPGSAVGVHRMGESERRPTPLFEQRNGEWQPDLISFLRKL